MTDRSLSTNVLIMTLILQIIFFAGSLALGLTINYLAIVTITPFSHVIMFSVFALIMLFAKEKHYQTKMALLTVIVWNGVTLASWWYLIMYSGYDPMGLYYSLSLLFPILVVSMYLKWTEFDPVYDIEGEFEDQIQYALNQPSLEEALDDLLEGAKEVYIEEVYNNFLEYLREGDTEISRLFKERELDQA